MSSKNKIIYIIGAARSGTTLLDIILGNAPQVFSAGEINRFTKRNGIPHDARDAEVQMFWKTITEKLASNGLHPPSYYYQNAKKFEYHNNFFRLLLPYKKLKDYQKYKTYQQALFTEINNKINTDYQKNIIIDSSKYPLRAFFLSHLFGTAISYIYIRRNPVAIVDSFQKKDVEQPSKNRFMANLYLLFVNSIVQFVIKTLSKTNKVAFVNYENLLQSPAAELQKIERDMEINLSGVINILNTDQPLNVGLLFDGNRLRLQKKVIFRKSISGTKQPQHIIDRLFYRLHALCWYK